MRELFENESREREFLLEEDLDLDLAKRLYFARVRRAFKGGHCYVEGRVRLVEFFRDGNFVKTRGIESVAV